MYNCIEVQSFITSCIACVEKLKPTVVAEVLLRFVEDGDFQMNYNPDGIEDKNCSAINLLEQACFEMGEISYKLHGHRSKNMGPLYKNFLYSRMLWVSIAMKFHGARRKEPLTNRMQEEWKNRLVTFHHRLTFNVETCTELREGLELGRLLVLPFDLACNNQHLSDLLVKTMRPFHELRNCVEKIESVLSEEYLLTMLAEVKKALIESSNSKLMLASANRTLQGTLKEVHVWNECGVLVVHGSRLLGLYGAL